MPEERRTNALRRTNVTAQYSAVRVGADLTVLPAYVADRDLILARVLPSEAEFIRTFWMSRPAEARHLAHMLTA